MSGDYHKSADFQYFYARLLFREYRIRKFGPLGKDSWKHLLISARAAKCRYWQMSRLGQMDLFGGES